MRVGEKMGGGAVFQWRQTAKLQRPPAWLSRPGAGGGSGTDRLAGDLSAFPARPLLHLAPSGLCF